MVSQEAHLQFCRLQRAMNCVKHGQIGEKCEPRPPSAYTFITMGWDLIEEDAKRDKNGQGSIPLLRRSHSRADEQEFLEAWKNRGTKRGIDTARGEL